MFPKIMNMPNTTAGYTHTKEWTQTLIDHALALGGHTTFLINSLQPNNNSNGLIHAIPNSENYAKNMILYIAFQIHFYKHICHNSRLNQTKQAKSAFFKKLDKYIIICKMISI